MKTITAKEFQLNQSQIMHDVAAGKVFQVTYHGKPWVELRPGNPTVSRYHRGSINAFQESLKITLSSNLDSEPDYKQLRANQLRSKYDA